MSTEARIRELEEKVERLTLLAAAVPQRSAEPFAHFGHRGRVLGRAEICDCDVADECEMEIWEVEFIDIGKENAECAVADVTVTQRNAEFVRRCEAPPSFGLESGTIVSVVEQSDGEWLIVQKYGRCADGGSNSGSGCNSGLCGPDQVEANFVTSVTCVDGALVVCDREVCFPAGTTLGLTDCGGADPGSGVPGEGEVDQNCCPGGIAEVITATITHSCATGASPNSITLTWNGVTWYGQAPLGSTGHTMTMQVRCGFGDDSGFWIHLRISNVTTACTFDATDWGYPEGTCDPLAIDLGSLNLSIDSCCTGAEITGITIDE